MSLFEGRGHHESDAEFYGRTAVKAPPVERKYKTYVVWQLNIATDVWEPMPFSTLVAYSDLEAQRIVHETAVPGHQYKVIPADELVSFLAGYSTIKG